MFQLAPQKEVLFAAVVILIIAFRFAVALRSRTGRQGEVLQSSCVVLWPVVRIAAFAALLVELILSRHEVSLPVVAAGLAITVPAIWLRRRALVALGRFYSVHVEVLDDHRLVEDGPYGLVRHPLYLSYSAFLVGLALVANAYVSEVLMFVLVIPFLVVKTAHEERALVAKLGGVYREYQKRVPALIPLLRFHKPLHRLASSTSRTPPRSR